MWDCLNPPNLQGTGGNFIVFSFHCTNYLVRQEAVSIHIRAVCVVSPHSYHGCSWFDSAVPPVASFHYHWVANTSQSTHSSMARRVSPSALHSNGSKTLRKEAIYMWEQGQAWAWWGASGGEGPRNRKWGSQTAGLVIGSFILDDVSPEVRSWSWEDGRQSQK